MKKLLLLAILALFTANLAQSEILTETNKLYHSIGFDYFVPDKFAFNNKGSFYIRNYDEDSRIETITLYNSDIQETAHFDIKSDKLYNYLIRRERQQDAEGKYTGEWVETRENSYDDYEHISYYDVSSNSDESFSLYFSQTLFNNDEKYEFIVPVYGEFEKSKDYSYEYDRDYDGEIDAIYETYDAKRIGFDVVNQDGNVLCSVRPTIPDGYKFDEYPTLLIIGGKRYLVTEAWEYDGSGYEYTFYLIDPNSTSLQQVGQPLTASVFPTMPRNNDVINVELDGNDKPGEIVVTNTKGQTVYKQKVAAGERRVQINSRRLNNGLNIITVNNGDEKQNFKVIVK